MGFVAQLVRVLRSERLSALELSWEASRLPREHFLTKGVTRFSSGIMRRDLCQTQVSWGGG